MSNYHHKQPKLGKKKKKLEWFYSTEKQQQQKILSEKPIYKKCIYSLYHTVFIL